LNSSGQVVSKQPIEQMLEADPVLLDDGLVLPLPSRLKLLAISPGKKPVMDWIAPVGENLQQQWAHLVRLDGRELIAVDQTGLLMRIQSREGEVPHLAEVSKLQLNHPVDVRPVLRGESLFVADASGTLRQFNIHSFDTDGERSLTVPIRGVWLAGQSIVVYAGDHKLYCLAEGNGLPEKWSIDIGPLDPVGPIVVKDNGLWLACRSGTVLVLNAETGVETRRLELPQSLSLGLRQINETLIVVACDGTIYRVE
jgi:outer membrane protein assembly factor BamB